MKNHKLYSIWKKVPTDYYQKGVRKNLLQRLWHGHKVIFAKEAIKNLKFQKCLDVGSASGFMISEISKAYPHAKYYGIDIFDKAIACAKKNYPHIKFTVAPAEVLPYKDNSFDLILFYETIEHTQKPLKALKEIKRVINKDGRIILAMDSGNLMFRIIWSIWEKTTGRVWDGAHLHRFHHKKLEELIKIVGLKVQQKVFTHLWMEVVFILSK